MTAARRPAKKNHRPRNCFAAGGYRPGMHRALPACLVSSLLLLACSNPGEDDDGGQTTTAETGGGIPTFPNPTTGDESGDTTADPSATDSSSGSSDEGNTTMELNCGTDEVKAEVVIPRVMLVLDKSGSMVKTDTGYWDHDGDDADDDGIVDGDPNMTAATPRITRWQSLYETVDSIVTPLEERMDFGAVLFPSLTATKDYDERACKVSAEPEVPIGPDQGQAILMTIPPALDTTFQGGTPAAAGVTVAVAGLATDDPADAGRPQFLILVTDGAANCPVEPTTPEDTALFEIYDGQLPIVVADALASNIPTFVIGIDIKDVLSNDLPDGNPDSTNTYEKLNEVAEAGGQARPGAEKFYNAANQIELQAALMEVTSVITSCTFNLSKPLDDAQFVKDLDVDPDGAAPLNYGKDQVADCSTESGWHFTDETESAIELCGDACTLFKESGDVNIVFDCIPG